MSDDNHTDEEETELKRQQVAAVEVEPIQQEEVQSLKRQLEQEKRKSDDYLTRLKYLQADFDNYRKRTERELRDMEDFSTTKLVLKLLPVLDELELATAAKQRQQQQSDAEPSPEADSVSEGIAMVLKNMTAALQAEGLKPIEAIGKTFDPKLHEAVDKVEGDRQGDDIVIEEIRKGYTFRHRLLRPSLVKVELGRRPADGNENKQPQKEGDGR